MADHGPEVRIGLVLYGGVSLAVYIYGVVIEVQRLLAAAAELERGEQESAYAKALAASGASSASVDIVSGTSAGGINGILLAKALARRANLESARRLWIGDGDIAQLLQPPSVRDPRSLLQSGRFEEAVREGLARFEREAGQSTVGEPAILDLFVSATHLRGGPRLFKDSLGREIHTRQHRYVFRRKLRRRNPDREGLASGYERDDFDDDEVLIRLARATSAFPVAFEPVLIRRADGLFDDREDGDGWFADGGILNNKPFTEAVDAIVSRESDRPVRRWLFSLDPDPAPLKAESGPGKAPPFDQVALRSVATIPRYQSIARDLVALKEHNEKVDAADAAIRAGEAQRVDRDGGDEGALGPGPLATYAVLRRQAWGKEVADSLVKGAVRDDGEAADWSEFHRGARLAVEGFDPELEGVEGSPDLAFHRRRIYYLIKLLSMAVEIEGGDPSAAREALWAAYKTTSRILWESASRVPLPFRSAGSFGAGEETATDLLSRTGQALSAVGRDTELELGDALAGLVVVLEEDRRFPVPLAEVLAGFESRDAILLAGELYGGMGRRDRVRHAQISPLDAGNTGVEEDRKLAGVSLGHFGGFLDAGWRENDIMWGRLDGAEVLMRAVLNEAGQEQVTPLTDAVQEEVLAAELPEVLAAPGGWKAALQEHVGKGPAFGDLDRGRLVGLAFRAAAVVRRMLSTAARDSAAGGTANHLRAFLLRSVANALGLVIALLYLPATAVFGKGMVVQRAATAAVFLPFLWGLATLLLGCIGVLPIDDVALPAAIAIAIYPAALLAYWFVRGLMARIWRRRKRPRPE